MIKPTSDDFFKKRILLLWALLSLICLAYAVPQEGDYQTVSTPATVSGVAGWQIYQGGAWVPATVPLSGYLPDFEGDIYANHNINVDVDFHITGDIISPNTGTIIEVRNNAAFTSSGNYELRQIRVLAGAKFVNLGNVTATDTSSRINLMGGTSMGAGGVLENHGIIDFAGTLYAYQNAKIISKEGATITGPGRASNYYSYNNGFMIEIANVGGYNEAFQLTGGARFYNVSYVFNGDEDQVTGTLPGTVYSLDVVSGHTLTLSAQVNMTSATNPARGEPYFRVHEGSALDVGSYIISSQNNGTSVFYLDEGATIITAHADGISSHTVNGKIDRGSIQTNYAVYSSAANYTYSGNVPNQFSGCFTTTPDADTVNDLTVLNPNGLTLCPDFYPLTIHGVLYVEPPGTITGYYVVITLPVTLSYLNAYFNGYDSVVIQWETQSETNNLGFYVYRSEDSQDANAILVSPLIPSANSSQGAVYYFEDKELYHDGTYHYWLQDVSISGQVYLHGPVMVQVFLTADGNYTPGLPFDTSFIRNYPNPFNPSTHLEFYLERNANVTFEVFNLKGQLVDYFTLFNRSEGFHRHRWEPQLGSGIYLVKFTANGRSNTRKVILAK